MVANGKGATESAQIGHPAVIRAIKGDRTLIDDGPELGWWGRLGLRLGLRDVLLHAGGALDKGTLFCADGARLCAGHARRGVLLIFRGWGRCEAGTTQMEWDLREGGSTVGGWSGAGWVTVTV